MKSLSPFVWYALALTALGLTTAAYLRPDMIVAAWGVIGLCFS